MQPFRDRLKEAAAYAGIEYSQTAIARSLGISKQAVDQWMGDGGPSAVMIFRISDAWGVNARWLATGEGELTNTEMFAKGLPARELARRFRVAMDLGGVSAAVIAESCRISPQAVSAWGKTGRIASQHIPTVARVTGQPLAFFVNPALKWLLVPRPKSVNDGGEQGLEVVASGEGVSDGHAQELDGPGTVGSLDRHPTTPGIVPHHPGGVQDGSD